MASMTLSGLGSGLDTSAVIDSLMAIERRPVDLVTKNQTAEKSKLDLYRAINTKLTALQTAAKAVASDTYASSSFNVKKSAVADEEVAGVKFSGQVIDGLDAKELRGLLDQEKQRMGSGVAAIIAVNDGKASIAAAVTDDLTGKISAVDLVRAGVEALGGKGGGGRPDMAQGGGPDGGKASEAIAAVKAALAA